ncbi:hypothetical protein CN211_26100 [Sinorhizobium meliloti]|nr:hypothetical protein CN211_26100 [Sinorhizobium meliloti]
MTAKGSASMRILRTIPRFVRIAVLCFAMVSLHGFAAAEDFQAAHHCPPTMQVHHDGLQRAVAVHPGPCCTTSNCCSIPEVISAENISRASRPWPPLLSQAEPFLLVRVLYPPPKLEFS